MSLTWLIVLYLGVALAASRIPFVRVYLALCHTLMEEVIRVLGSCCFKGGRYSKINLYRNGSGQTIHQVDSKFKKAVIEYAGYTGTSLAAIGLFFLVSRGYNHLIIYLFIGLAALSLLLWIRTLFGAAWGLSFVFLLGVPVFSGTELVMLHLSILLSAVILTQSILKAFQVL